MTQKQLSKTQLAALDLLIAKKQEDPNLAIGDILGDVVNVANAVGAVTAAAVAVAAVVAGAQEMSSQVPNLKTSKNISLQDLLAIREHAGKVR